MTLTQDRIVHFITIWLQVAVTAMIVLGVSLFRSAGLSDPFGSDGTYTLLASAFLAFVPAVSGTFGPRPDL
jgi:hypothetical protein